jgi:DNA-3-methyladenine glycosylase II
LTTAIIAAGNIGSARRRPWKLIDRSPDLVFSAAGPVHVNRDLGLLAFNLGLPERPSAVSGIDVALVRDGRIARFVYDLDRRELKLRVVPAMTADKQPRKRAVVADPEAREFLRNADPVLARLIDARPDFQPRAWMDELPPLDGFGTLVFQVVGQQLSVAATRAIVSRIEERFGGRLPTPVELLAANPQVLRSAGLSARKGATLRGLAERFVDGRLSDDALAGMTDDEVEAALTEVPGIGPWSAHGFLLVALDRPDVFLTGDIALRRAIQRLYEFDHVPTPDELIELSDRWRPYRSLAVSYIFASEYAG